MNPKEFGHPTPFSHSAPVDKSGSSMGHAGRKFRGERPSKVMATSVTHDAVTPTNLPNLPMGGTDSHPGMAAKSSTATAPYGPGSSMMGQPKSGDLNLGPAKMKKHGWKAKGYKMNTQDVEMPASEKRNGGSSLS